MKQSGIFVLDFDGVICDSVIETGISGWKAAAKIWDDMPDEFPGQALHDQFRSLRPYLETGYEAILIIRLLFLGETVKALMSDFAKKTQTLTNESNLNTGFLKELFGNTRDQWIEDSFEEWLSMNPLFPGVAEKLTSLSNINPWYIVTTKQERFVQKILNTHQIVIPDERLFGLEHNMSKEAMLLHIMNNHPDEELTLIEDRLPTLQTIAQNDKLQQVNLLLAAWGYNTAEEKSSLDSGAIQLLTLENFLCV